MFNRDVFDLFSFDLFSFDGFFNFSEGVRIDERKNDIVIELDIPGRTKKQISVLSQGNTIKVIAEAIPSKRARFSRLFGFGDGYDYNNVEAKYENGVLVVTIHKLKNIESSSTKQIHIQ
jgi:HSP20 family molecular chaperone IbpA